MVRVTLDGTLKASAIILAGSLSLAALAHAWAATTRTVDATVGNWPAVYRENLITGELRYCVLMEADIQCLSTVPRQAFAGGVPANPPD